MTMKVAQTATAIGLLAASAVFTPALAAMSCWDFTRGSDGSWTPLRPFVLDGPTGMVRMDPGNSYNAGMPGVPGRVAANLTLHCPGVPHGRVTGPPPKPNPYLLPGSGADTRWGNQSISSNGVVISHLPSPSGGGNGAAPSNGVVLLNPPSLPDGGSGSAPSNGVILLNPPSPSGEGNGSTTSNGAIVILGPASDDRK